MTGRDGASRERFRAHVYRAHHPRWSHAPTSGAGAALHGGRFNRPGVTCLYTSRTPETAWLEAQQGFPFKARPMTLCAYDVDCEDVLDLTRETVRGELGVTVESLACPWEAMRQERREPPTWTLSDTLREQGVAGIVVPSFADRATSRDENIVFWRWSDEGAHRVRVIDDFGRLPVDDDASWPERSG